MRGVKLDKKEYEGYEVLFQYETSECYKVKSNQTSTGFCIELVRENLDKIVKKEFTGELYKSHWEDPEAYAVMEENRPVAIIQVARESWSKRLRVTDLCIEEPYRRRGYGRLLMNKAKEIAKEEECSAIILETQTCNTKAISFYLAQGFRVYGLDMCCYSNTDVERDEVRLEMAYLEDTI